VQDQLLAFVDCILCIGAKLAAPGIQAQHSHAKADSAVKLLDRSAAGLQDLLLAFVDCVERNGAKLAIPRTVLELDPSIDADSLLPRMSAVGLLPPPGAVGGYGGRGPNIPITVQVSC
jgi:hypothetical protein